MLIKELHLIKWHTITVLFCNGVAKTLKRLGHQRETTGSSSDFLHIGSLFKIGASLKGKNSLPLSLPEGANSFL